MVTLEQYQIEYGFNASPGTQQEENSTQLREKIKVERFRIRKKIFAKHLRTLEMIESLKVHIINLPIVQIGPGAYEVKQPDLFIGGIEQRIISNYRIKRQRDFILDSNNFSFFARIYVGDLPPVVVEKYERAKRFFAPSDIIVVSKERRLFDTTEVIVPKLSPLLVAFKDNVQYLLAFWGLEYEIEERFGGKLPNQESQSLIVN